MKILVFYGSVRTKRKGIRAAVYIKENFEKRGHTAEIIDPLEYDFGLLDFMYKEYAEDEKPEKMKILSDKIKNADGYIVVSGEYNHSIPPALSNLMDYFLEEYFFKPSAIVAYSAGIYGGARVAMQLRAFLNELGCVTIPILYLLSYIERSIDESGRQLKENLEERFGKFAKEFEWYMQALKDANEKYERPY